MIHKKINWGFVTGFSVFFVFLFLVFTFVKVEVALSSSEEIDSDPTWYVDEPVIYHGELEPYDYYAAKDPTIVYYDDEYHIFYTGANESGGWQMLYTSASTISGLEDASRTFMSSIEEAYFCAPQVFYFEPHDLWYLVYQDGTHGAAYSITTDIADPDSWDGPHSFDISGKMGWDYFIICDDDYAYMYNTPEDSSHDIYVRRTALSDFPHGWSEPEVAVTDTFEGANVYKSLADGQYYLTVEDMKDGRYYELWTSESAGGPWTQVAEKWAWHGNITFKGSEWTHNVSHGEIIRAGYDQKMEINNINAVDFLIQGSTDTGEEYQELTWDIGLMKNYTEDEESGILGDINGDNEVNSMDLTLLRGYILGQSPENFVEDNADINEDGSINSSDFTRLTLTIVNG